MQNTDNMAQLTKREQERAELEKNGSMQLEETRHLFIGGWQNFDMDYFLKRHSRSKLRNKNAC